MDRTAHEHTSANPALDALVDEFRAFARDCIAASERKEMTAVRFEEKAIENMQRLSVALAQECLRADPRADEKRCPACNRAMIGKRRRTHKKLLVGEVEYERNYGFCAHCRASFSPSGHRLELR